VATFSVIVGTVGRKTLRHTLRSITSQLEPGDELFVLRDDSGDAGDTPRNQTMHRAAGSHLLFMDDGRVREHAALRRRQPRPDRDFRAAAALPTTVLDARRR
jgi:hypothetical protein